MNKNQSHTKHSDQWDTESPAHDQLSNSCVNIGGEHHTPHASHKHTTAQYLQDLSYIILSCWMLLMLEIYKCLNSENPSFMWNIYQTKDVAYNLRTQKLLQLPSTNTLSYGNDSLSFRGAILWNTLSDSIKVWQPVLALRDQLKSGRVTIARAKYVDKESVGISPEVYLYIIISRL